LARAKAIEPVRTRRHSERSENFPFEYFPPEQIRLAVEILLPLADVYFLITEALAESNGALIGRIDLKTKDHRALCLLIVVKNREAEPNAQPAA
jgi:hypothetical protein